MSTSEPLTNWCRYGDGHLDCQNNGAIALVYPGRQLLPCTCVCHQTTEQRRR